MAIVTKRSITLVPRSDNGALDQRAADGNPLPIQLDITVGAITLGTLTVGTPYSLNLASFVSGSDKPGATYSFAILSGSSLASLGLAFAGSTLSGTPSAAGSFTAQLTVSKSGFDFPSGAFSGTVAQPVIVDNLAPTVPAFLTVTADAATPKNVVTFDWPMDVRQGNIPPTNPVKVDIYRKLNAGGFSALTTLTALGPQPDFAAVGTVIGTMTAPSFSQSGADLTIANVVDGTISTSQDNLAFYGAPLNWAVGARFIGTLPAFSSGNNYSHCGLMVRQSLAPFAACVAIVRRSEASGFSTPLLTRAVANGAVAFSAAANISGVTTVCLERGSGDTWIFTQYDPSGTLIAVATVTVAMSGPVYLGWYGVRDQAGAAITCTGANLTLNALGRQSYNDTAVVVGNSYSYEVRAADSA